MILVDTSFLVSLTNPKEKSHAECAELARRLGSEMLIPITVIGEAAYMIGDRMGQATMRRFMGWMSGRSTNIEWMTKSELERAADLLDAYADLKLDFVDATVVALAETLSIKTILTLDRRDFSVVRPAHCDFFTILPEVK